ncbi:MAG: hypothetical protein JSS01_08310 [Proteobacteria bacterium]|nr:hypothetical protein [Pseudomonadota bacterium]
MTSFVRNPSPAPLTASARVFAMIHNGMAPGRAATLGLCLGAAFCLPACTVIEPQPVVMGQPAVVQPAVVVEPPPVVSVYADPPLEQPEPVMVPWAPPPLLVQAPPPPPFAGAVWVGGYWAWQGRWVWSAGYWDRPPRPGYVWMEPYYEHRGNAVVFVNGFWSAPGVAFVPPPVGLHLSLSVTLGGAFGVAALGPQGVFVPAPPGSVAGVIVPAPLGTPPAVVTGAPAVVRPGMRIVNSNNVTINNTVNNTVVNNVTIHNERNIRNVRVEAPATATASHAAFSSDVPARAALAAAVRPQTHWEAPLPQSRQRFNLASTAGHAPMALPPAQTVRTLRAEAPARPPERHEAMTHEEPGRYGERAGGLEAAPNQPRARAPEAAPHMQAPPMEERRASEPLRTPETTPQREPMAPRALKGPLRGPDTPAKAFNEPPARDAALRQMEQAHAPRSVEPRGRMAPMERMERAPHPAPAAERFNGPQAHPQAAPHPRPRPPEPPRREHEEERPR